MSQQIASGQWSYNLSMTAYSDPERTQPIESSSDVQLNDKIWVELKAEGLDENMAVIVTDSCWATNQPSPRGSLRYDLIVKG